MCSRKIFLATLQVVVALLASAPFMFSQAPPKAPKSLRLYVFDNGSIKINPESFHFTKEELATVDMIASSYLIVHPKGTLMWDSGSIPDADFKAEGSPVTEGGFTADKTLKSQLAAIGYTPKDITYFPLSHYHIDHVANANEFAGSTWLVQQPERDAMFAEKAPPVTKRELYIALKDSKTKVLDGEDYDVFGDGTVIIKAAYGHTPGHQVLYLKLPKTGPVLLAGDLYHYPEERFTDKTPTFEFNHDESLASRAAMEAFIKKAGAQLWIEHDLAHFNHLKKAPSYYE